MNFKYLFLIVILAFSIVIYISKPWETDFGDDVLSTIAIFTAIGSAIGLVLSHIHTAYQIKQESDAKFLELTHQYTKELVEKFDKGFEIVGVNENKIIIDADKLKADLIKAQKADPKDDEKEKEAEKAIQRQKEQCVNWAFTYVDSLDEVAYVKKKNAIPARLTDYFGPGWFGMAKSLMVWHDEVVCRDTDLIEFRSAIETWPHVYEHCFKEENGIKPVPPIEFPPVLLDHFELKLKRLEKLVKAKQKNYKQDLQSSKLSDQVVEEIDNEIESEN